MEERTMGQKLLAEFVGTFTVIFIGAGATIATGIDGTAGLVTVALAYGLAYAVMVSALRHVSGAHLNPAVTIGAWVTQKIALKDGLGYVAAQIAGGTFGALLLRTAIPDAFWRNVRLGTPGLNPALSQGQGALIEAVLAFFLVWVVFATVIDPDGAFDKIAGLAVGLAITMGVMMAGPLTSAAINPARWFGPALVAGSWTNWWVWILGPVAGGIVAAVVYDSAILRPREVALATAGEASVEPPEAEPEG